MFGVEIVVTYSPVLVPPGGPEKGRDADDEEVEWAEVSGLEGMAVFVEFGVSVTLPILAGDDDVPSQADATPHLARIADDLISEMDVRHRPQESEDEESDEVLRELPDVKQYSSEGFHII